MTRTTFAVIRRGNRIWEVYLDWSCLMVGINFALYVRGIYVHIGPLIAGTYISRRST